jgi:hypothetical protein
MISGSGWLAGRESEAAVVLLEPGGQHNRRSGKGRCFVDAQCCSKGCLVSAVTASSTTLGSRLDPVRALQHALYRAAKADPGRRFHALRDKVFRRDVLWRAWVAVRRNDGAPGIDMTTLDRLSSTVLVGCSINWPAN